MSGGVGLCWPWNRPVFASVAPAAAPKPDEALLYHLDGWFRLQAARRGYEVEHCYLWWSSCSLEVKLSAEVRKDDRRLLLEAKTYGETSEDIWGSARRAACDRYTRLLGAADCYLAAGACRAMIRDRASGLVEP